jgi:hypothetical protein
LKISFDCDIEAVELAATNQVPNAMMGILLSFASRESVRRGLLERWKTRINTGLHVVCQSLV